MYISRWLTDKIGFIITYIYILLDSLLHICIYYCTYIYILTSILIIVNLNCCVNIGTILKQYITIIKNTCLNKLHENEINCYTITERYKYNTNTITRKI